MDNLRVLQLVSSQLALSKMEAEMDLEKIINSEWEDPKVHVDTITHKLSRVRNIMQDIQLWEQYMAQLMPNNTQTTN